MLQRFPIAECDNGTERFDAPPQILWVACGRRLLQSFCWLGFPIGALTQGATLDELQSNLQEVIEMLLEDGEPRIESEFVGIQTVRVA